MWWMFGLGFILGAAAGVFAIALVSAGRDDK